MWWLWLLLAGYQLRRVSVGISTERALLPTFLLVADRSKIVSTFIIAADAV
jgi:hypothetical protein